MQDKLSIPTDNIYKFYAIFGLVLFVFSIASMIYTNKNTNELIFSSAIEKENLLLTPNPTTVEKAKLLAIEKRLDISLKDKSFFNNALSIFVAIGTYLSFWGFMKWVKVIQPIQDETAKLQLEKLRIEVNNMKKKKHVPFKHRVR